MHHFHDVNPWAANIIYPTFEEWLDCLRFKNHRSHYVRHSEERQHKVDCYILPQPSGHHSMGMRYGTAGEEYYSPMADYAKAEELIRKYSDEKQ